MRLQEITDLHGTSHCIYICLGLGLRQIISLNVAKPTFPEFSCDKILRCSREGLQGLWRLSDEVDNPTSPRASNDAFNVIGVDTGVALD